MVEKKLRMMKKEIILIMKIEQFYLDNNKSKMSLQLWLMAIMTSKTRMICLNQNRISKYANCKVRKKIQKTGIEIIKKRMSLKKMTIKIMKGDKKKDKIKMRIWANIHEKYDQFAITEIRKILISYFFKIHFYSFLI